MKRITQLNTNEVLVFGSNLLGVHGAGAARDAHKLFGAQWGVGEGLTGQCYALPTKDFKIQTRTLYDIAESVQRFILAASARPELTFIVTPVGCGLAGMRPEQIAPMFKNVPKNCVLPDEFKAVLNNHAEPL